MKECLVVIFSINAGALWIDPDNDVKWSKDKPQHEVPEVQVESNVPCCQVMAGSIPGHGVGYKDQGVPGRHSVFRFKVDANPVAAWNDSDNNVKGSKSNPTYEVPEVQVESYFPCDRGLVDSIHGHLVGDKDGGVAKMDHVAGYLKGVIHEPLFEKAILQTVNPIDSYDEGSDPVVDSLQVEL